MADLFLPVQIVSRDRSLARNRLTVLGRGVLAFPHYVWWGLWGMGALVALPWHWLWVLATGTASRELHGFYAAYVRYSTHLLAYLSLAAHPYPRFLGERGSYPVDVAVAERAPQRRWTVALRLVLVLPPLLLTGTLAGLWLDDFVGFVLTEPAVLGAAWTTTGVLVVIAFLGWFAQIARGRGTAGFRDLAIYCVGYAAQVCGYLALLTDRFPDSAPAHSRPQPAPAHPLRAALSDDGRRSRLTTLFRAQLIAPHVFWLTLWGVAVAFVTLANWVCALATGRAPGPLHRFVARYVRYQAQVSAFLWLVANPFPGFLGRPGSFPYELEIDPPERQHRAVTLFRIVLVVPALLVAGALAVAQLVAGVGAWCVALLTGRMPAGLRDLGAFCIRYRAQLRAYLLIVTDRYPYAGPTLETGTGAWPERPSDGAWLPPVAPQAADWLTAPEAVRR